MSDSYEGDLVRPLGLVTLNAAYAEGELDELLDVLAAGQARGPAQVQRTMGGKLARARRLVRELKADDLSGLSATLEAGRDLFARRNALVHGRIHGNGFLVSSNRSAATKQVSSEELTELAEAFFAWKEQIWLARVRHLVPLLAGR